MYDIYTNLYRVLAVALVVFLFFVTGRPYFNYKMRIFISAITAGVLNGFGGGALLGTSLDGIPLRFAVAFMAVGAGVAILEYIFPEGGTRRRVRS
ncbi:hypothetical protein ACFQU2_23590 [Siccirubricoccus deserti]|uniref:Uncharacterized protein n=1 Tax=Siccirubricoccus deserti TaxID=2013562 RepID=A0A9X0QVF4_9PROT|nr:hypothetical protein [Siccirubricoccus deserti]MBC4014539.1 hypothetical protein [Siccirubricoccus deserti]